VHWIIAGLLTAPSSWWSANEAKANLPQTRMSVSSLTPLLLAYGHDSAWLEHLSGSLQLWHLRNGEPLFPSSVRRPAELPKLGGD
jgi:hypothetical protein